MFHQKTHVCKAFSEADRSCSGGAEDQTQRTENQHIMEPLKSHSILEAHFTFSYCACKIINSISQLQPVLFFAKFEIINHDVYSCIEALARLEFVACTIRLIDSVLESVPLDESLLSDSYKSHVLPTGCFASSTWIVFSLVCLLDSSLWRRDNRSSVHPSSHGANLFSIIFVLFLKKKNIPCFDYSHVGRNANHIRCIRCAMLVKDHTEKNFVNGLVLIPEWLQKAPRC